MAIEKYLEELKRKQEAKSLEQVRDELFRDEAEAPLPMTEEEVVGQIEQGIQPEVVTPEPVPTPIPVEELAQAAPVEAAPEEIPVEEDTTPVTSEEPQQEKSRIEQLLEAYQAQKNKNIEGANTQNLIAGLANLVAMQMGSPTVEVDIKPADAEAEKFALEQAMEDEKYKRSRKDILADRKEQFAQREKLAKKQFEYQKALVDMKRKEVAPQLSPGQKRVDSEFAKEYNDFIVKGGFSDFKKQYDQLQEVVDGLESGKYGTGYLSTSYLPGTESSNAKEAVAEVTQRNLKLILGGQFSEREGKQLIERAYNPLADEKENIKRVTRLMNQMKDAVQAKKEAIDYFEENGTMAGYRGKVYKSALEFLNPDGKGTAELLKSVNGYDYFKMPDGSIKKRKSSED